MSQKQLKLKSQMAIQVMSVGICLGTFLSAYSTVCLSQIAYVLQAKNQLNNGQTVYQLSISTSAFNFGSIVGPLFFLKFKNKFGYLRGLLILDILSILFLSLQLITLHYLLLSVCRFALGVLVGLSVSIIPVYLRQLAPIQISGKLGSYNQVLQVIGTFCCYCVGFVLDDQDAHDEWRWRLFLVISVLAPLFRIIILQVWFPFDSLQGYVRDGNHGKIQQYCSIVYTDAQQATKRIIATYEFSKQKNQDKRVQYGAQTWKHRFILALVIIAANQLTGINGIMYYTKQLFNKITHNNFQLTKILMIMLALFQIVSAYLSGQFIDRIGRRKILLYGICNLIFILFSIFLVKLSFVEEILGEKIGQGIVVLLIFSHIFVHNMSLSPVCVVYCTEIVEDIWWIIITLKVCSFSIAMTADYMIEYLGFGNMFLIFGIISIGLFLYLSPRIIETKALTKKQIYDQFAKKIK